MGIDRRARAALLGTGLALGLLAMHAQEPELGTLPRMADPSSAQKIELRVSADGTYRWRLDNVDEGEITPGMGVKQLSTQPGRHEVIAKALDGTTQFDHIYTLTIGRPGLIRIVRSIQGPHIDIPGAAVPRPQPAVTASHTLRSEPPSHPAPAETKAATSAASYSTRSVGNPAMFASVTPRAYPRYARIPGAIHKSLASGYQLMVMAIPMGGTYYDVKVQMVMKGVGDDNATVTVPDLSPWMSPSVYTASVSELGKQAVVCYTARRPNETTQERWTGTFDIQASSPTMITFLPAHEPTLTAASDAPCGGLTPTREMASLSSAASGETDESGSGADAGDAHMALVQGSHYYNARSYAAAKPYLITACNSGGSVDACNSVGFIDENGLQVPRNYREAREYYLKGCNDDASLSCNNLGTLYERGLGLPPDRVIALQLYQKACDAGVPEGCDAAGKLYMTSSFPGHDYARAMTVLRQACEANLAAGCGDEGYLYFNGLGVPRSLPAAAALTIKSCEMGSPNSCFDAGMMYRRGDGVPQDPARSNEYFQKACRMGEPESCGLLR